MKPLSTILILLLAFSASAQLPPFPLSVVADEGPEHSTNHLSLTLAWSNSPSVGVVGTIVYCFTNGTLYGSLTNNNLTNQCVFPLVYIDNPTHEGWTFRMVAYDDEGNVSPLSNTIGWHIPWLDYAELIISNEPKFEWSPDLKNWYPLPVTNSSFTAINNGVGQASYRYVGKTTVKPTIK